MPCNRGSQAAAGAIRRVGADAADIHRRGRLGEEVIVRRDDIESVLPQDMRDL
jgi:hypothetical protein